MKHDRHSSISISICTWGVPRAGQWLLYYPTRIKLNAVTYIRHRFYLCSLIYLRRNSFASSRVQLGCQLSPEKPLFKLTDWPGGQYGPLPWKTGCFSLSWISFGCASGLWSVGVLAAWPAHGRPLGMFSGVQWHWLPAIWAFLAAPSVLSPACADHGCGCVSSSDVPTLHNTLFSRVCLSCLVLECQWWCWLVSCNASSEMVILQVLGAWLRL